MPKSAPEGFKSAQDKRALFLKLGILTGALFLLGLAGFITFFVVMTTQVALRGGSEKIAASGAALWNGNVYYTGESGGAQGSANVPGHVSLYQKGQLLGSLPIVGTPSLLAGQDKLWLFTDQGAAVWDGHSLTALATPAGFKSLGHPFLYHGLPALLAEKEAGDFQLLALRKDGWAPQGSLHIKTASSCTSLDARFDGKKFHLFYADSNLIRSTSVDSLPREADPGAWDLVGSYNGGWACGTLSGEPIVFIGDKKQKQVSGFMREDGKWKLEWVVKGDWAHVAIASQVEGQPVLFTKSELGRLRAWGLALRGAANPLGKFGPKLDPELGLLFMIFIFYGIMLLAPVLILLAAHAWTRRHREFNLELAGKELRAASLGHRALASLLDSVLLFIPIFLLVLGAMAGGILSAGKSGAGALTIILCALLIFASILCLALLQWWWMARWGKSPGKWLLHLTVVRQDTLEMPGWGRAILRSLLFMVDGQMIYTVGILLVALSPRYQRLGDLAAGTVVIVDEEAPSRLPRPRVRKPASPRAVRPQARRSSDLRVSRSSKVSR